MGQHPLSVHKYLPGDVLLGRFQLERQLAVGGMGELWRAVNVALEQPVAVKLLRSAARNPAGAARLLQEARVAARLSHRAIVRVFDAGTTDALDPFLVMELLEGGDAATLLEQDGPLDAVRAVQLMIPVLSGLAVAHRAGVVHRDIKPENVFLARLGDGTVQPKLIDFGLAHLTTQRGASKLTVAGTLLGTPEYMSPEQIACRDDIDGRADIWAVGVTLYQLVADTVPFAGETMHDIFDAVMAAHVPFPTSARGLDGGLWSVITDCLRRERDERFASVEEVERALTAWLAKRGVTEDYARHSLVDASRSGAITLALPRRSPVSTPSSPPPRATSERRTATLDHVIFSALEKKPS